MGGKEVKSAKGKILVVFSFLEGYTVGIIKVAEKSFFIFRITVGEKRCL